MQDQRIVKILIRNQQGEFLVMRRSMSRPKRPGLLDLPGGHIDVGETDLQGLDRELAEETGLVLNTEDAIHIGFDAEYEPGEGMCTRILYMLKIETERPMIRLSEEHEGFEWVTQDEVGGFDPPFQVLVHTALDFYL